MTPALALYQIFVIVLTLQEISETPRSGGSAGPYCGVYCVAAAARMCGRDINIAELTDQRFVGYSFTTFSCALSTEMVISGPWMCQNQPRR